MSQESASSFGRPFSPWRLSLPPPCGTTAVLPRRMNSLFCFWTGSFLGIWLCFQHQCFLIGYELIWNISNLFVSFSYVFMVIFSFADWLSEASCGITSSVQSPPGPSQSSQFWPEPRGDLCVRQLPSRSFHPPPFFLKDTSVAHYYALKWRQPIVRRI